MAGAVAGLLALGGAAGTLISVERAVVRVSVAPRPVAVKDVVLAGAHSSGGLTTTPLTATVSESMKVASSTRQLPATFAFGYVSFWCSPMTSCPNGYTVPAGTALGSVSGAEYYTLGSASFPSCQPSSPVAIRAAAAGSGGNSGAGAITYGALPSYIHVRNYSAIGGGLDPRALAVVQQSDIDAAAATLSAKLATELQAKLHSEAGLLSYLPVGAPVFQTTSDAHAGDNAPSVTVTVTGTSHAVAFSAAGAQALLRGLLTSRAPGGYELATLGATTYSLDPASGALTASSAGYAVPAVNANALTLAIRGQSLTEATALLHRVVPGSAVNIRTQPLTMPWLPMLADHISFVVATTPS